MTHQGFIGSFSTSALLVSAAVSILLIVSAIVAFEGWPGPTGDTPTETFLLKDRGGPAGDARPRPELVLDPPRASRSAATADSATAGSADAGAVATDVTDPGAAPAPAPAPAPVDPAGTADTPQTGLPADPAPSGGGTGTLGDSVGGGTLGGTVDRATGAVDGGAEGLAPVTDRVQGLRDSSTGAVDDLIGGR